MRQLFALFLMGLGLTAWAPAAAAQLTDILDIIDDQIVDRIEDSVVGDVVDRVEDSVEDSVIGQVASQVEQSVEQAVQGVVDSKIGEAVTRTVDATVGRTLDSVGNVVEPVLDPLLDPVLGPLTRQVNETVERTFGALPELGTPRDIVVEDNWRAVENEWIALIGPNQLAALNVPAVRVLQVTPLEASGQVLVRVAVSAQDNTAGRAQQLLRSLGASAADRNHVYVAQGAELDEEFAPEEEPAPAPQAAPGVRVGLIDTALNRKHAALKQANVVARDFVDGKKARPTAHGTSIASLLVGGEKGHEGLLPKGQLVAASVFYQGDSGATGATTSSLIASLDWMAQQKVGVVNMSLAGPPNEVLGDMIARLSARGMVVVAAVGNDGPASRPLYPAAFEPVVAVTAVDRKSQIYRWANQGPQVDLAAWGVGERVARDKGGYEEESGTSYAAPIVSARLAEAAANGAGSSSAALKAIIAAAEDLGARGRDNVYGYGLVRPGQ